MTTDFLPIQAIDYVELYVGNAKQAAHFYRTAFGFTPKAYAGLETGVRDRASYLLEQGEIRLILTGALGPDSPVAEHVRLHGDGVKDIAMRVDDCESAFRETVKRGARPVMEPTVLEDQFGVLKKATIAAYGDTVHSFVERKGYQGVWAPGFRAIQGSPAVQPAGLAAVDHIVGNVELGAMLQWVKFYEEVMGFTQFQTFDDKDISTEYSALMSKVMAGGHGKVKFPINEPASGRKKSQIQEYLDFYHGPGAQHIALITGDILTTVDALAKNGVEFLNTPDSYYDDLESRVGTIPEPMDELRRLKILVDRDEEGYLLQIFTKPVGDRPTVFFEIIQRKGSRGFGKGNFKALFEAIEREQELRGNL
ncbi:MAG TPA: 4-hydroxyphenylpyruvate dioxygenase [Symbiobacteriaceae bacterium]|nr:4-hydroxyphenylpyruvate dioxygenase [Symbiobacteriaceae bacterium]